MLPDSGLKGLVKRKRLVKRKLFTGEINTAFQCEGQVISDVVAVS